MLRAFLFLSSFIIVVGFTAMVYLMISSQHQPLRAGLASEDPAARHAAMVNAAEFERAHIPAVFGCAPSQYLLGRFLAAGEKGYTDKKRAVYWFEKSAAKGNADAELALARLSFLGDGMAKDEAKGAVWVKKAADAGSARAKGLLGVLYMGGIGVDQNLDEGMKWLKQAKSKAARELYAALQAKISVLDALPPEAKEMKRAEVGASIRESVRQSFGEMISKETSDNGEEK